ncbi:hypothetical protein IW148_002059 [Coemansia sp. RSA 1199]|nr:hypothetical protein IW148_002059 [Coemansia sp. RSA 1199]
MTSFDEHMSWVEVAQQVPVAILPAAPSAISTVPSGATAMVSIQGSLELFGTNGQCFSGCGIQWSAQQWEAVQCQCIAHLPENCNPADIVIMLMSLLTGDAQKAMSGATPSSIDGFFQQLGQCYSALWYHHQVSNTLESGAFFHSIEGH